ncbi:MAG: hypothetical protein C4519_19630 [Desulfobacteraceae bacterium]|nr:MAG: hypothetical protein C4519_19630 [Desulfobacteraceae bacterium]
MEPVTFLFIAAAALIYWFTLITIPAFLIKRAMAQVVGIFRSHRATEAQSAKSVAELGLKPRAFMDRFGKSRDYKPTALKFLLRAGVIIETFDKRVYLSEKQIKVLCENNGRNRLGLCKLAREKP